MTSVLYLYDIKNTKTRTEGGQMFNWKKFIDDFKKSKIVDNGEKYVFRLSNPYLLHMTVFFGSLGVLAVISLINSIENKYYIRMSVSVILIGYAVVSLLKIFLYKIIIEKDYIKYGKCEIKFSDIKTATLTIGSVTRTKVGKCLEIISNEKKEYVLRLNIHNPIKFLKIIENRIGDKFIVTEDV